MSRSPEQLPEWRHEDSVRVTPVSGGHMSYERILLHAGDTVQFGKIHDSSRFTDPTRERHSREYLAKEQAMMTHLRAQDFPHIPAHSHLIDDHTLIMEGLSPEDGWQWRAPHEATDQYVADVTSALSQLAHTAHPTDFRDSHGATHDLLVEEGWPRITPQSMYDIKAHLQRTLPQLRPHLRDAARGLIATLPTLAGQQPRSYSQPRFLCHHDLRQANIAWHPAQGARLVDWSWAGLGLLGADHTSLLIDLHKSGHDIHHHLSSQFNPEHAQILLGYLLARSVAPGQGGSGTVRFHQAVSAISAFDLINIQEAL